MITTGSRSRPSSIPGGTAAVTAVLTIAAVLTLSACDSPASTLADRQFQPTVSAAALNPPFALDADYRAAVTGAVATSLKLDEAQVRGELGADPNATLMNLAKPLGLAQDQLARTIRSALTAAADRKVRSAAWTSSQASQVTSFWAAQPDPSVITEVSRWFHVGP